jgi:LuxR family maltose regulon positive regulatory protein
VRRVAEVGDAGERLARLARDTPVFAAGEANEWLRMHALARDELRRRFALLPADEQGGAARARGRRARRAGLLEAAALTRSRPVVAKTPTTSPSAACTNR